MSSVARPRPGARWLLCRWPVPPCRFRKPRSAASERQAGRRWAHMSPVVPVSAAGRTALSRIRRDVIALPPQLTTAPSEELTAVKHQTPLHPQSNPPPRSHRSKTASTTTPSPELTAVKHKTPSLSTQHCNFTVFLFVPRFKIKTGHFHPHSSFQAGVSFASSPSTFYVLELI